MNGTIRPAPFTLGALAVALVGAFGCQKERPAREPTPTFESRVGEPQTTPGTTGEEEGMDRGAPPYGGPGTGAEQGQPGQPGMGQRQPGQPGQGMMGQEQPGAQTSPTLPETQPMQVDEVGVCEDLSRAAKITIEDVQGGVALVLTPKPGQDVSSVKDVAHRVHSAMSQAGTQPSPTPDMTNRCTLFDIGRQGATAAVVEGPGSVRILLTTTDPSAVKTIRSQARDFSKQQKTKGGGAGQRGIHGGTTPGQNGGTNQNRP